MTDKRDKLKEQPFSYREFNGKVFIYYQSREIKVVKGKEASKLLSRLYGESDFQVQLVLAKITGHFKH